MATNLFGQNAAAIAANETQCAEMWAQDATAMNGYVSVSSAATQLIPFTAPQPSTNGDGLAHQAAAVAQATNSSTTSTTELAGVLNFPDGSNGSLVGVILNNNLGRQLLERIHHY